jgi:DNA-directed RNA polymerase beta' subunit
MIGKLIEIQINNPNFVAVGLVNYSDKVLIMKRLLFIAFFLTQLLSSTWSQIKEEANAMSQGVANSFSLVLPDVQKKLADDLWKDYIKKYGGKYKFDRKQNEHQSLEAVIGTLSLEEKLNIYASIKEVGSDLVFTLWIQSGNEYISSRDNADKYEAIELQMQHFAREVAREKLRLQLRDEEKQLSKIEQELQRLVRKKESLELEIEKARKRIEEAERDIQTNIEDQGKTEVSIKSQQEIVRELKQKLQDM